MNDLDIRFVDARRWRLLADFARKTRDGREFIVHKGDTTDFASVPWWSQSLIPRTGTWTKGSVGHDKRCDLLNAIHKAWKEQDAEVFRYFGWHYVGYGQWRAPEGWFNSVDTDRIFREDVRDDGTDPIRAEILWVGVRLGALVNPARREGWLKTAPRVLVDLAVPLSIVAALVGAFCG